MRSSHHSDPLNPTDRFHPRPPRPQEHESDDPECEIEPGSDSDDPTETAVTGETGTHRVSFLAPPRAAGGAAAEVAAANPDLARAVPATVGGDSAATAAAATAEGGGGGPGLVLSDGSGMDVPELAVQRGWGGGAE
jgi:hypothetical protein